MNILTEIQKQIKEAKNEDDEIRYIEIYQHTKLQVTTLEKKLGVVVMK